MTRFARAKGSKASNERKEEDPTPWHVMRQQLAEHFKKDDNDCENKSFIADNTTNMKPVDETWIEFNEFKLKKPSLVKDRPTKRKVSEKVPKSWNESSYVKKTSEVKVDSTANSDGLGEIRLCPIRGNTKPQQSLFKLKKSKNTESKIKKRNPKANIHSVSIEKNTSKLNMRNTEYDNIQTNENATLIELNEGTKSNNLIMNKNNSKINRTIKSNRTEFKAEKLVIIEDTNNEQDQTKSTPSELFRLETSHTVKFSKNLTETSLKSSSKDMLSLQVTNNKKGFEKEIKTLSHKHSHSNVQTIIANGRKIDIVKFEAFWIKKEDASKLKELRKKLRDQKMPKDKIKTIIKLERRKAEKALSREKTNVCYHCRKFGHKFSECPEVNDSSMTKSGICFKCGSTEHTHFECKVTHSQNFRYAVCFVCNEQGHIARQCSLNPQGQYPKGGSCHLCGEVTHLRKDCPKAFEEKPSSLVTVEKLNNIGLEDVSEMKTNSKKQNLVRNKVVLF